MANPARKQISRKTQAAVMIKSRNRCALCFYWYNDPSVKAGQLAHIDRRPANSAEENLAFLCLEHHDQYDSKPSQTKRVMPEVLMAAKHELQLAVADGCHFSSHAAAIIAGRETDRMRLEALIVSMRQPMHLLRGMSFASQSFSYLQLDGLDTLVSASVGAEHEFINPDLEVYRQELIQACESLFHELLTRTRRLSYNDWHAVPQDWRTEQPKRFEEAASVLDAAAVKVGDAYDKLVRHGRARLSP